MKKILHILLISCFSFTITSCAEIIAIGALGGGAYWYKDDISAWYDEFSKESDETEKTDAKLELTTNSTISEKTPSFRFLFVSVGGKGTILTSSNGTKWTKRTSGSKGKLRAVAYGNDTFVVVGFSGTILTSSDGAIWTKRKSGTKAHLGNVTYANDTFVAVGESGKIVRSTDDGSSWDNSTSPITTDLKGVTFSE